MNRLSTTLLFTPLLFAYFGAGRQNVNAQSTPSPVSYSDSEPYSSRVFDPTSNKTTDKKKAPKKKPQVGPASTPSTGMSVPNDTLVIPVAVYNNTGIYVRGLSAARFKAFINDKQAEIVSVESKNEFINIVLLLDTSPSTDAQTETIRNLALRIIERLLPEDRITVVAFNQSMKIVSGPGADRELATKALKKLRMGDGTSLYDAVWELFEKKLGNISGPTAKIIMTDGVDTTSRRVSYQTSLIAAEKSSIPIFPVYFDTFKTNAPVNVPSTLSSVNFKLPGDSAAEYELGK